jgi:ATP-dependent Clp protease ATP-binding subunit ClpA
MAAESLTMAEPDVGVGEAASAVVQYAMQLARASETYEVHSWMLLLGILKYESTTAAQILQSLGLDDLYGAWNEVLWALHACDGLKPRAFATDISFAYRAFRVLTLASDLAVAHGKDKIYSEDLLLALAAGGVLQGLFPDLDLSFARVRKAIEKHAGRRYVLPTDKDGDGSKVPALKSDDDVSFL